MFESQAIANRVDAIAQDLAALIDLLGGDHAVAPQSAGAVADAIATVKSVGRLMDSARVRVSAPLIDDPLWAERLGHASLSAAVASIAGISDRSARARLAIAGATCKNRAITGEVLAASRPAVSAALDAGRLGLDAANLIVTELRSIAGRTPANVLDIAESVMVGLATGVRTTGEHMAATVPAKSVPVDFLTGEVRQVTAAADPDGARPREERATRRREFRLGAADEDGLVSASGRLLPEIGSLLAGMLDAYRRSPRFVGTETSLIDANDLAVGVEQRTPGQRTPGQRRHDALGEILLAAAATEGSPQLDGHAVTVLVTVTAADLADENGRDSDVIGVMSGSPFPVARSSDSSTPADTGSPR